MPVPRTRLVLLGLSFVAVGLFWIVVRGERAHGSNPRATYRFAGGMLIAIGLLCLGLSVVW